MKTLVALQSALSLQVWTIAMLSLTPPSRRDCYFADTPFPSILRRLLTGEGRAA